MYCPICGAQNPERAVVCGMCDANLMSGVATKVSGLAVASLVLGVLGLFTCGVTAIPGLILGIIALVKIGRSSGRLRGRLPAFLGVCSSAVAMLMVAAIAIPSLMASRRVGGSTETAAIGVLKAYVIAQGIFRNQDHHGKGYRVYANPYTDLLEIGYGGAFKKEATALKLIDQAFADAHYDLPATRPKAGYVFDDITAGPDGKYDPAADCGLCAAPHRYNRTGRSIYIINAAGEIYRKDAAAVYPGLKSGSPVVPITVWPDVDAGGWTPMGR